MINATFCGLVGTIGKRVVPLSVKSVDLDVTIRGWSSGTTAKLVYENSLGETVDAQFVVPATENIGIYKFEAQLADATTLVASCQPVEGAEDSVDGSQLAAVVYRIPIGKLDAGKRVTIQIGFVQQLRRKPENGQLALEFASTFIPHQLPRWEISDDASAVRAKLRQTSNHVAVSDVEYNFSIKCNIDIGLCGHICHAWLEKIETDSNAVKVDFSEDKTVAQLTFSRENFRPSSVIALTFEPNDINLPAVCAEAGNGDGFGSSWSDKPVANAWYEPGTMSSSLSTNEVSSASTGGSEYWLILDRSGSMFGAKNEEAKRMLLLFVKSLPLGSKFNVVGFGTTYEALFPGGCVDYTQESAETAVKYATILRANFGGTSVMGPLKLVYDQKEMPKQCRFIILLTDGQFAESVEAVKRIVAANAVTSRLFTIGIGKDVNRQVLEELARVGSGMSDFIEGIADFQTKVIHLMKAMSNQSLAGFKLDWSINGGIVDKRVPVHLASAFYYGSPMRQSVGITRTSSNDIPLTGTAVFSATGRPTHSVPFSFSFSESSQTMDSKLVLHRFIAFQQLLEMLETSSKSAEAAKLSQASGILCKYTSFVLRDVSSGQLIKRSDGSELASIGCRAAGFEETKVTNKAEIRAGKPDEYSVQLAEEVVAPIMSFEAIAGLQQINGGWKLNEVLVNIVGLPHLATVDTLRDRVKKSVAYRLASSNPQFVCEDDVLGTLVGLAVLRKRFLDRYSQWLIIEQKAHAHLQSKGIERIDDELIDVLVLRLENEVEPPTDEDLRQYENKARLNYFAKVDQHALALSRDDAKQDHFYDLINRLINSTAVSSDLEKARALFIWLSSLDLSKMLFFGNHEPGSPEFVLMELKAGRATYAAVYEMLCLRAGLTCVTIEGYVKGIGYHAGMKIDGSDKGFDGCWNAVKIDGKFRLVNANWAARRLSSDGLQYKLDEYFFLTDPQQLIYTHFPKDARWQLLDSAISLDDFENLPPAKSLFFTIGLKFVGETRRSIIQAPSNGEIGLQLEFDRPEISAMVDFDYALLVADHEEASVEKLHGYARHEMTTPNTTSFHLRLPQPGKYRFIIFAARQDEPFTFVDKDARQTYTDICEWLVIYSKQDGQDNHASPLPYPPCSLSKWGAPHEKVADIRGFSLIQPTNGVVITDSLGLCEIHFQISTKQEMFLVSKVRCSNKAFTNEILERSVFQRRVGNRVIFTFSAPGKGEFGLEIFTNRVGADSKNVTKDQNGDKISCPLFPFCQYLIVNEKDVAGPHLPSLPPNYLGPQTAFDSIGLTTLSHSDPFITVEDEPALEVVFGLSNGPVRAVANFLRMADSADSSDEDFSTDWVLHQTPQSGDRITFLCRFPKPGTYKLEIFALTSNAVVKSKAIPCVYNYLIEATVSTNKPFPKQYSQWHDGCFLIEPIDGVLKWGNSDNNNITFKLLVSSSAVRRVLAVVDNVSQQLDMSSDGVWEAKIPREMATVSEGSKNKLVVMANFIADPPGSFAGILEYKLED